MAGSPRYLNHLYTIEEWAMAIIDRTPEPDDLWRRFDDEWEVLSRDENYNDKQLLTDFAATGLALLGALTGTSIPALRSQAAELHIAKNAGYAGEANPDPWANFRMAEAFGVSAFKGALIRLSDKYIRTVNLRDNRQNERVGEAITETIRDAIAYPLIARCLQEEEE